METDSGITIYAELLSNIRRISVGVSLPSASDSSTRAEVADYGRRFRVFHQGQAETLDLPVQTPAPASTVILPLPGQASLELSWRLLIAPMETDPFSAENQAIPWTSLDVKVGSQICCRNCNQEIVPEGAIKIWKDLPSENWAEMMEFWHCHKPHDHEHQDSESLASKGYGANSAISAQASVGFVDLTAFLFSESDCNGLTYTSSSLDAGFDISTLALDDSEPRSFLHVFCKECNTEIGLFNILATSVTLFKWQITCRNTSLSRGPTSSECLAATLIATISRSGSSKSILTPHRLGPSGLGSARKRQDMAKVLSLWVLNPNVTYSSSTSSKSRTAMKILYRRIDAEEGDKMMESMNSDVQEISLPTIAIQSAEEQLKSSSLLLPTRERQFKEWNVGLLGRWEAIAE